MLAHALIKPVTWSLDQGRMPRFGPPTLGRWPHFKHPLSTSVALLVLPWLGFLLNTWLGVLVGIAMYVGSRTFAPADDAALSKIFGSAWARHAESLKILWLCPCTAANHPQ